MTTLSEHEISESNYAAKMSVIITVAVHLQPKVSTISSNRVSKYAH